MIYKVIFISALVMFCLSACVSPIQLRQGPVSSPDLSERKWKKTQHSFLWGWIAPAPIKVHSICKDSSWESFTISRSFLHNMVSLLTLGLYVPSSFTLVCKPPLHDFKDEFSEI